MMNDTTTASSAETQMDVEVKQCTICYSAPRSIRFHPCGHWTVCEGCTLSMIAHSKDHLLACPSCKTSISGICLEAAIPTTTDRGDGQQPPPLRRQRTYEPPPHMGAEDIAASVGMGVKDFIDKMQESDTGEWLRAYQTWNCTKVYLTDMIEAGNLDQVQAAVRDGASVTEADEDGEVPLVVASSFGHLELAQWLVANGADVNAADHDDDTPLLVACGSLDVRMVEWLHSVGADIHAVGRDGQNAIGYACTREWEDDNYTEGRIMTMCDWLHTRGVSVSTVDEHGCNPMYFAAVEGFKNLAKWLFGHGCPLDDRNNDDDGAATPFLVACCQGHLELAMWLQENGADVNAVGEEGSDAVLLAAREGHLDMLRWLHEVCKLPLDRVDHDGEGAVHLAAMEGHISILEYLHKHSADLNATNEEGNTPMHLAARNPVQMSGKKAVKTAQWLHAHGASMSPYNNHGFAPIHESVLGSLDRSLLDSDDEDDGDEDDDLGWLGSDEEDSDEEDESDDDEDDEDDENDDEEDTEHQQPHYASELPVQIAPEERQRAFHQIARRRDEGDGENDGDGGKSTRREQRALIMVDWLCGHGEATRPTRRMGEAKTALDILSRIVEAGKRRPSSIDALLESYEAQTPKKDAGGVDEAENWALQLPTNLQPESSSAMKADEENEKEEDDDGLAALVSSSFARRRTPGTALLEEERFGGSGSGGGRRKRRGGFAFGEAAANAEMEIE